MMGKLGLPRGSDHQRLTLVRDLQILKKDFPPSNFPAYLFLVYSIQYARSSTVVLEIMLEVLVKLINHLYQRVIFVRLLQHTIRTCS